jgi:hypothetical protein
MDPALLALLSAPPASERTVDVTQDDAGARMPRGEKLQIIADLITAMKAREHTINPGTVAAEATKKDGVLHGKTTFGSLRVFLYTLQSGEKTRVGF